MTRCGLLVAGLLALAGAAAAQQQQKGTRPHIPEFDGAARQVADLK